MSLYCSNNSLIETLSPQSRQSTVHLTVAIKTLKFSQLLLLLLNIMITADPLEIDRSKIALK